MNEPYIFVFYAGSIIKICCLMNRKTHQYENGKSDWYLTEQALREVYGEPRKGNGK